MKLRDWEATIQQMIEDSKHESMESAKFRVLMKWRVKLAQEPHVLQPFEIDKIVREARKRLTSVSAPPSSGSATELPSAL